MAAADTDPGFADLLDREVAPAAMLSAEEAPPPVDWVSTLAELLRADPHRRQDRLRRTVEALVGEMDLVMSAQLNAILHAPDFQELEATWRSLWMLVRAAQDDDLTKVKLLNISKRELSRTLRKFRGDAWDRSPIFLRVYEEEFGQFGGEPFGVLMGDYTFDHRPDDVALLSDMAKIAAAAHAPFISAAAPALMQMDEWDELANPRDVTRIFLTPEYTSWRSMREQEDMRYVGLCLPRFLVRLPYGALTDPLDAFAFEEETDGPDQSRLLWGNAAYAFVSNTVRAFAQYGWCVRIRGIDRGGIVHGLPVLHHPTADGDVDRRTVTEICLSERREAELASCGLMPLVHRKNTDVAAFISAQSLQKPETYASRDATANASLSSRLPYLFACSRFAHYLKCMVRDKIGSQMGQAQLASWLNAWLLNYVDASPNSSREEFKAAHPLADGKVTIEPRADMPGMFDAKCYLRPHYQLEGLSVALRLMTRLPSQ